MTAALSQWPGSGNRLPQRSSTVANIILPVDGRPLSRLVLPIGRTLAQLYNATPHLLYVGRQQRDRRDSQDICKVLGLTTDDISGTVLDFHCGNAAEVIVRTAKQLPHSLIVMCTHTENPRQAESFGRVAEAVLAAGPARIVLVAPERTERPWRLEHVLLAHDGTPSSDAATAPAADIARRASAQVIALHVAARNRVSAKVPGSLPAPRYVDQPQHEWPAWTQGFMDRMLALGAPPSAVHFDLIVAGGQAGSEIAELARRRNVDLVVMACDGNWSDTKHACTRVVVRTSGCPVLLVRPGPAA